MTLSDYNAEQEYERSQELLNTKEILDHQEYALCFAWDPEESKRVLNHLGDGRWLNINVYCEYESDCAQLAMVIGG